MDDFIAPSTSDNEKPRPEDGEPTPSTRIPMQDTPRMQPPKRSRSKKALVWILVTLLVAAGAAYGAYYWQQKQLDDQQAVNQKQIAALRADVAAAKDAKASKATTTAYSVKMPNNKTISYPLTDANATILWWYGNEKTDSQQANGTYLYVSSTKLARFISTIPGEYLKTVCGNQAPTSGFDTASIDMFALTTSDKTLTKRQAANCVDMLSSSTTNKAGTYKDEAVKLLAEVKADIDAWVKDVTIK